MEKSKKTIVRLLSAFLMISVFGIFGASSSAYAEELAATDKALLQGLDACYSDYAAFKEEVNLIEVNSIYSILTTNAYSSSVFVPNLLSTSGNFRCSDLLYYTTEEGVIGDVAIPTSESSYSDKNSFLSAMGYSSTDSGEKCFRIKYEPTEDSSTPRAGYESLYTSYICAKVDDDGKIASELRLEDGSSTSGLIGMELTDNNTIELDCAGPGSLGGCGEISGKEGTTWGSTNTLLDEESFMRNVFNMVSSSKHQTVSKDFGECKDYDTTSGRTNYEYCDSYRSVTYQVASIDEMNDNLSYELNHSPVWSYKVSDVNLNIDNDETAELYISYLKEYYAEEHECGSFSDDKIISMVNVEKYQKYRNDANGNECYVRATQNENEKVNGVENGKIAEDSVAFEDIVAWLNNYTGTVDVDLETAETLDGPTGNSNNDDDDETKLSCLDSGAAESLGWIVCPVLKWMGNAATYFYDELVEPALTVEPTLFNDDADDGGTKGGWSAIRNIANVAFIIILLVVIFSQLTGFGIDNYGIKKVLPKMIVAAILINLSYWICVALVDVSNIIGNGLQAMFDSWASYETLKANLDGQVSGAGDGGLVTTGILAAMVGGSVMLWSNPGLLLALLVSALGVLVSIFFLFIMLATREAAIVVLIIISPLAIICFMLPNTKSYFDKWKKFFGSLLLVYPIIGLLVGGGNFVSKLLLASGDLTVFSTTLTAMLAGIVPIFFIPTVLKKSLAMAGDIGSKISGVGSRFGGGVQRGIRNSDAYRRAKTNMNAGAQGGFREKVAMKTGIGRRSMARARAAKVKDAAEEEKAKSLVGGRGYNAALTRVEREATKQAVEDEINEMARETNNYDERTMDTQLSGLLSRENLSDEEEVRMKALMSKMATKNGFSQKLLAKTVANTESSAGARAAAARYASRNGDVGGAIAKKDGARAQYLRDINAGRIQASVSYDVWKDMDYFDEEKGKVTETNMKFVTGTILTDDRDFVAQSSSAVEEQLPSLSDERLSGIINNERLMDAMDSDVKASIEAAANAKGIVRSVGTGGASGTSGGGGTGETGAGQDVDIHAVRDEVDFVSNLSSLSDKGLNDLYENKNFRSTLSESANQALEREYDQRTAPGSKPKPSA